MEELPNAAVTEDGEDEERQEGVEEEGAGLEAGLTSLLSLTGIPVSSSPRARTACL